LMAPAGYQPAPPPSGLDLSSALAYWQSGAEMVLVRYVKAEAVNGDLRMRMRGLDVDTQSPYFPRVVRSDVLQRGALKVALLELTLGGAAGRRRFRHAV